jgi:hypothetical protein
MTAPPPLLVRDFSDNDVAEMEISIKFVVDCRVVWNWREGGKLPAPELARSQSSTGYGHGRQEEDAHQEGQRHSSSTATHAPKRPVLLLSHYSNPSKVSARIAPPAGAGTKRGMCRGTLSHVATLECLPSEFLFTWRWWALTLCAPLQVGRCVAGDG